MLPEKSMVRETFSDVKNKGLLDLLEGMLQFNPEFRLTASECLQHKVFDQVRKLKRERPSNTQIDLAVYKDGEYNYEKNIMRIHTGDSLKQMIFKEAKSLTAARTPVKKNISRNKDLGALHNSVVVSPKAKLADLDFSKVPGHLRFSFAPEQPQMTVTRPKQSSRYSTFIQD